MALSQHLVQKQTQKLVITQDLRQSIELLPLSNLELADRIQKELLENPFLEMEDAHESPSYESQGVQIPEIAEKRAPAEEEDGMESFHWKENRESLPDNLYESAYSVSSGGDREDRKHQFLQNALSSPESLSEHLLWQLRMSNLSPGEMEAGELIVSDIDSRGFLKVPLEELIGGSGITPEAADRALKQIYEMDPIGCGATSIQESLLIQSRILHPGDGVTSLLLKDHFEDLENLDYKKIERATGLSAEEIENAIQFIRTLEPFPGTLYAPRQPDYILPDISVTDREGKIEIYINDEWIPSIRISEEYENLLKKGESRTSDQDREYLLTKRNSAHWLKKSIEQRRQTLIRVMGAIVEFQREFFLQGPRFQKPLTLREVAEKVELHESTISRITTNKYVQTKWGTFELKHFFSSSLKSRTGEESHSARTIQDRIRQIIGAEDPEHPLSDQDIMDIIQKEGVQIARRTVAKYRKLLKILPVDRRKKLKKLHPGH